MRSVDINSFNILAWPRHYTVGLLHKHNRLYRAASVYYTVSAENCHCYYSCWIRHIKRG